MYSYYLSFNYLSTVLKNKLTTISPTTLSISVNLRIDTNTKPTSYKKKKHLPKVMAHTGYFAM